MSRGVRLLFLVLALVALGVFVAVRNATARIGILQVYTGSAEVTRNGRSVASAAGTSIRVRDQIAARPDSRVAIVLKDGSVIRLEAGTTVAVASLAYRGTTLERATFHLTVGRIWSRVAPLASDASFEVETPTIVAAVHGTSFNTDYRNTTSDVYVYRDATGVALTEQRESATTVPSGQRFPIRDDHRREDFAAGPHSAEPEYFDDWIRFNQAEDDKLEDRPRPTPSPAPSPEPSPTPSPTPSPSPRVEAAETTQPSPRSTPAPSPTPKVTPKPSPAPAVGKTAVSLSVHFDRTELEIGESTPVTVLRHYRDGTEDTITSGVTWTQSSPIGAFSGNTFTASTAGSAEIRASLGGLSSDDTTVEVHGPKELIDLELSYALQAGTSTAQFTATAVYSDDSTEDVTTKSQWKLAEPAHGTITPTGLYTAGQIPGDNVTATYGNISASLTVDI